MGVTEASIVGAVSELESDDAGPDEFDVLLVGFDCDVSLEPVAVLFEEAFSVDLPNIVKPIHATANTAREIVEMIK